MNILGINGCGWLQVSHDPAAVLVEDGKITWGIEEERLIRQKRAYEKKPFNSVKFCLHNAKLSLDEIDYIAFSWDWDAFGPTEAKAYETPKALLEKFFPKKYFTYKKEPKILLINHHLSHAASAFRCSGMDESAVLILDGQGEICSTSIWHGKEDGSLEQLWTGRIEDSLGFLYSAACRYIGMNNGDEGKLMGLAPYGSVKAEIARKIGEFKPQKEKNNSRDGQMKQIITQWLDFFEKEFGPKDTTETGFSNIEGYMQKKVEFTTFQKDFAASIQHHLEEEIVRLTKNALRLTNSKKLCLSGGVAMNCIANHKILQRVPLEDFYVQAVSNDAGTAIGAALEANFQQTHQKSERMNDVYLGPSFSNEEIKKVLEKNRISYEFLDNPERKGAEILAEGKILAWFQDRMEFGPRALGNRSILADASIKGMDKKVNLVKNRESWRPFAPSILKEEVKNYFSGNNDYLFMIVGSDVKKNSIPAVTHTDKTSRPHSVDKNINQRYYQLIKEFESKTGFPVILNTSFNNKGEPLVCTPEDALRTFFSTRLEHLIIGNFLITKNCC